MTSSSGGLTVKVELGADIARIRKQFFELEDKVVARSISRSLNRVAITARAEAAPVISAKLNGALPVPVIRRAIVFSRARADRLYVDLRALGGKRVRAALFKPKQTKLGVTVRIGSKSVRIPKAFITPSGAVRVRGPNWNGQFFDKLDLRNKRIGYKPKQSKKENPDYPIPQIYIPGVPGVFLEQDVIGRLGNVARTRFPIEFERDLKARSKGFFK